MKPPLLHDILPSSVIAKVSVAFLFFRQVVVGGTFEAVVRDSSIAMLLDATPGFVSPLLHYGQGASSQKTIVSESAIPFKKLCAKMIYEDMK